ncbi:MAG: hypothetical protein AAF721_30455 [Myxococcota bacterium]
MADDADETALARRERGPADRYEAEFMAGEGTVLYRAKARAHWSLAALILGVGGIASVAAWAAAPITAAATLVFLTLLWLLLAVLRVTVSEGAVSIQLGLWGPKIPIASIISAEATTYTFTQFGGWGIRISPSRGVMYNMPGDGGNALKIRWRSDGRERTTWVGTREAPELVRAIEAAKATAIAGAERTPAIEAGE